MSLRIRAFSGPADRWLQDDQALHLFLLPNAGAVAASADLDGIRFMAGEHLLSIYQFNTLSAKHYFCSKCGIYTHHQRRSDPTQFGINVACLEGVSPFDFAEVPVFDGVNHPNDAHGITRLAGTLRFIRREPD